MNFNIRSLLLSNCEWRL